MEIDNNELLTLRERIFIKHTSPEEREITEEITFVNRSDQSIPSIFLFRDQFMVGLRVHDEAGTELVVYTNELTKQLMQSYIDPKNPEKDPYADLLKRMDSQEVFVLWIRLPGEGIPKNQAKLIKLCYQNRTPAQKVKWRYSSLRNQKFLFSIPRFRTERSKPKGSKYDSFYVVTIPEGYVIDYKILKNVELVGGKETSIDSNKVYEDFDKRNLSIRTPAVENESLFDMIYEVVPDREDRWFYSVAVFGTIAFSAIITGITVFYNLPDPPNLIKTIIENSDALHSAIITATLTAIGFMRNSSTNRTRFWFFVSAAISGLGLIWKHL